MYERSPRAWCEIHPRRQCAPICRSPAHQRAAYRRGKRWNHIWAERFDTDIVDIFQVQDEGHQEGRGCHCPPSEGRCGGVVQSQHPRNLEAYDLCLKSRNLFSVSREANLEAEDMLEQALALDPDYAEAHWQLAMVRAFKWLQWGESQQPSRALALASAQAALRANPWIRVPIGSWDTCCSTSGAGTRPGPTMKRQSPESKQRRGPRHLRQLQCPDRETR